MENKKYLISIITPTYNRKELLEKAILSVINQKQDIPFEWEMMIVDDGSQDGTKEFIEKYLSQYSSNIKYFYQQNSGVGRARNLGIKNISQDSDYVIFLDNDDELIEDCIFKILSISEDFRQKNMYDETIGMYFLCKDENSKIIKPANLFSEKEDMISLSYRDYLFGKISFELLIVLKSNFVKKYSLLFEEDIINEAVLRCKMWQIIDKNNLKMFIINYVGRLYRLNHTGETRITRTISEERFLKNAIGNERVIDLIGNDLINFGYNNVYSEYLFRAGVNYILSGNKIKGLSYLKKSLKFGFSLQKLLIYLLALVSKKIILFIYKIYI